MQGVPEYVLDEIHRCSWDLKQLSVVALAGMEDEVNQVVDGIVGEFGTYEDYLDSQISATDLYYLEDEDLARQLVVRWRALGV